MLELLMKNRVEALCRSVTQTMGRGALIAFGFAWLSTGCIHYERRVAVEPLARQPSNLAMRLEAARGMTFLNERDEALGVIARDAARAGNVEVTRDALDSITFVNAKDDTAGDCALHLAAAGKPTEALEVARRITFLKKRDAILKQLATRN